MPVRVVVSTMLAPNQRAKVAKNFMLFACELLRLS